MATIGTNQGKKYTTISSTLTFSQLLKGNNAKNTLIVSDPDITGTGQTNMGIGITDNNGNFLPLTYSFDTTVFQYNNNLNTVSLTDVNKHNLEVLSYILSTDERFAVNFTAGVNDKDRTIKVYQYINDKKEASYYALNTAALLTVQNNIYNNIVNIDSNFNIVMVEKPYISSDDTYTYYSKYNIYPKQYGEYIEPITVTTQIGTSFTTQFNYYSQINTESSYNLNNNCYMFVADYNELAYGPFNVLTELTVTELLNNFNLTGGLNLYRNSTGEISYIYYYKLRHFENKLNPITIQKVLDSENNIIYTSNKVFDLWDNVSKYGEYDHSTTKKYSNQSRHLILLMPANYYNKELISFTNSIDSNFNGSFYDSGTEMNLSKRDDTKYKVLYYSNTINNLPTDMTKYIDTNCAVGVSTPFIEILPPPQQPLVTYKAYFKNGTVNVIDPIEGYTGEIFDLPNPPQKYGYTFKGWGTRTGVVSIYSWESTFTMGSKNTYYYACWQKTTLTTPAPTPTPTVSPTPTGA